MAPIDLPPEPFLNQVPTVSVSTNSYKTKHSKDYQPLLTSHPSTLTQSIDEGLKPSFSPRSLLPSGQLTAPSDDLWTPNLTQLPPLPEATDIAPEQSIDESTLDTINDAINSETIEDTELEALETLETPVNEGTLDNIDNVLDSDTAEDGIESENRDALEPPLEAETLESIDDAVNDALDSEIVEDIEPEGIEVLEAPLDSNESESLEVEQAPETIEDTDLETVEGDSDKPGQVTDTPAVTAPEPLDPSKLEIEADTQIFNADRQVVIARGNVVFKLNDAFLLADEIWVSLVNRYVLAEGNVILARGEQQVRGERAEYNLLQEAGTLFETRGEIFLPSLEDDFAAPTEGPLTSRTVFDPLNPDRGISNVSRAGGLEISSQISGSTGASNALPESGGGVRRLRFEAARVNFDAEAWVAEDVRLTNDPFSPPELEFRSDRVTLITLSPTADLLTTADPRLVFDQGLSLPLLRSRYVINRGEPDSNQIVPFAISAGIDSDERGGLFLESNVSVFNTESSSLSVTPQFFLERATNQGFFESDVFGFEADFNSRLSQRSNLSARVILTSLDLDELDDNLRVSVRNRNLIGKHLLTAEYSFRDRLFNGTLGFQDVESSLGAVLQSPVINLDGRGLLLRYQVGSQLVTARTDRPDLVDGPLMGNDDDLVTLGRAQASARLSKRFNLWRGKPLPATQTEGLRYTPSPLVPFLSLNVSLAGVGSYYTSDDVQEELSGDIRLDGQIGHLSKNFFDFTRFNLGYSQDIFSSDSSPFLFDRNVDRSVVSFGILQQIVGPILLGFQTSINVSDGDAVNTDVIFEYSRRTYGLVLRYSPTRETGSIGFRLSDFNFLGNGSPFDEPNIRQVDSGLIEPR